MFTFSAFNFVIAGAVAAGVVAAIHLWQRQRPRTIEWAAMDFLQQAISKRRRWLRLRDLLLLLLRCLCVVLLGLALAEPRTSTEQSAASGNMPVHAVFLLDNSLSMAEFSAGGTRLDRAKSEASTVAGRFAAGSRFTLWQLCASENNHLVAAATSLDDFREALARIEPVDASLDFAGISEHLLRSRELLTDWSQVAIAVGDRQARNFSSEELAGWQGDQPLYWISAGEGSSSNSSVTAIALREPALTAGGEAHLVAEIAHWGEQPRGSVQVTLRVDENDIASRTVDLAANQTTTVPFVFTMPDSAIAAAEHAILEVHLSEDVLPQDDKRYLWAPRREQMKIVLIDQYGSHEDPGTNRFGETFPLRKLLATRSPLGSGQMFDIRHLSIAELDATSLDGAQLVVVAGVADPAHAAAELQDYVRAGGLLWIAAGGSFSLNWHAVLPAGAEWTELRGPLPGSEEPLHIRRIDADSLSERVATMPGLPARQVAELVRQPVFFRTVVMELSPPADDDLVVLARFDDGTPMLIEQSMGDGRIWWTASGMFPEWNTLALGNGLIILEHLFDVLLASTLPDRNWPTMTPLEIPLPGALLESHYDVSLPGGDTIPLARSGRTLVVPPVTERGIISVVAPEAMAAATGLPIAQAAVNGPAGESDIRELSPEQLAERFQPLSIELVTSLDQIEATMADGTQHHWWRWFAVAMVALLLTELVVLALPAFTDREAA